MSRERAATGLADRLAAIFSNRGSAVYDLQIEINYTCTYRSLFLDTVLLWFAFLLLAGFICSVFRSEPSQESHLFQ